MAKISDFVKVDIDTREIDKLILKRHIEETVDKIYERNKEIHIEKIAFSLFCMHCYSHDFTYLLEDYLIDLKIRELKDLWELGKVKDKLQYFFNLAEKFYEVKFDK